MIGKVAPAPALRVTARAQAAKIPGVNGETLARCHPLVPESRQEYVITTLYALNTYPQWRFPERIKCISIVTREILDSGGLCKLALRNTTARVQLCHEPRGLIRSSMVIIQDACPRVSPLGIRTPRRLRRLI